MRALLPLTLLLALVAIVPPAALSCPGGGQARIDAGLSPYAWERVAVAVTDSRGGLTVDSAVSGCPGLVGLHREELARAVHEAGAGERNDGPFAISGLSYRLAPTETGARLQVSGPRDALDAFRQIVDDEQSDKEAGAAR
jgi:hypothetical protein